MKKLILTNKKNYTPLEVVDLFSEYVSPHNVEILVDHLTYPELSLYVNSFTEMEGNLVLGLVGGDFISVKPKK
jgi:hypothetical protein